VSDIKLTKNELRDQQKKLGQLEKYLPTLQLKKAMLQVEVTEAQQAIDALCSERAQVRESVDTYRSLLAERTSIQAEETVQITQINKGHENIAGVDVPYFESVEFAPLSYSLFETPPWVDAAVEGLRRLVTMGVKIAIGQEKKEALEHELREVSIRVNLFEKILIPRSKANIKKIKVFLGDQELAAVSQAKVAKEKIEARKSEELVHAD
jgi:V/A-type H+-transporting ATPase subunit D